VQAHRDIRRPLTTDTVPRSNRHLSLWLKIVRKMGRLAPIRTIQIPNGQSVKVIVVARNIMSATALRASVDHENEESSWFGKVGRWTSTTPISFSGLVVSAVYR
jgi:hypothetical protein